MEEITVKKNGLVYSEDMKTVLGVDETSNLFTGTVPNGAERIEAEAFTCCAFTRISLPESVKYVGQNLFTNSEKLEWVHLPSSLKTLSPYMFSGCRSLIHIDMPVEVSEFPEGLFEGCSSLQDIPFRYGISVLPENVFAGCASLTSLTVPNSVKKICKGAVSGCANLQTIVLPEKLEEIEDGAIFDCPKLLHIRMKGDGGIFYANAEGSAVFKKTANGDVEVFKIEKKFSQAAGLKDDGDENPSIIDFSDYEDDSEVLSDNASELSDEENEDWGADEENTNTIERKETIMAENEDTRTEGAITVSDDDALAARMAEIMGTSKTSETPFSITDIPEATDEEVQASRLAPSARKDEAAQDESLTERGDESEESGARIVLSGHAAVTEEEENAADLDVNSSDDGDMDGRLSDILAQEKQFSLDFSIADIPEASEEELAAEILAPSAKEAASQNAVEQSGGSASLGGVEPADNQPPESAANEAALTDREEALKQAAAIVDEHIIETAGVSAEPIVAVEPPAEMQINPAITPEPPLPDNFDEKAVMENLFFESAKVMQKNTGVSAPKTRILFVFAEKLCDGSVGKDFSPRLVDCCNRLAKVHNFTSVYYFHGIKLENDKFRAQFRQLMQRKDAVYAVTSEYLSMLSDEQRTFADNAGIKIDGESIERQVKDASDSRVECLKLILQDAEG
ncbi:MAG: leucine-rich repeat protein [Treponema sp.]